MDFIRDIFQYQFLSNALIASVLMGITCGIIGTYIVIRRLVFLSGGITHASFGGIGMAYWMGLNPIVGALVFSVMSAIGMDLMTNKARIREDSAIGVMWAIGMAIGIIFIFLTPGYTPNLMSFLFGNILTITIDILWATAILAIIVIAVFVLLNRQILFVAFDKEYSATQNIPTRIISSTMIILAAVTIVLTIKLVGIVLLVSLLTIPPITANLFAKSFNKIALLSVILTIIGSVIGLFISFEKDFPSGASIIIVLSAFYVISKVIVAIIHKVRHTGF